MDRELNHTVGAQKIRAGVRHISGKGSFSDYEDGDYLLPCPGSPSEFATGYVPKVATDALEEI